MKCCKNDLEIKHSMNDMYLDCFTMCPLCDKSTVVRMVYNGHMTHSQHREIGRLTLEDRGPTGATYMMYPYKSDLESTPS